MNSSKPTACISFSLIDEEERDILRVDLSDCNMGVKTINLNDSEQCQSDLKDTFLSLVRAILVFEVEITFSEDTEYPRELIYSAMKAYVNDLANEVQIVSAELESKLSELQIETDVLEDVVQEAE